MKKLATKLTPAIKAWIKDEFGSDVYYKYEIDSYFHFPNYENFNGFLKGEHTSGAIAYNYTLVSEQEFLDEFSKPVQYQVLSFGRWVDIESPIRIKPKPDYSKEIEALNKKANLNGMRAVITFEKL
ncbi:MAG: hypothetical protein H7239_10325 [Flavobacterium sp.]|nr:hypothetical protein [Flavobacterium sp.]